MSYPVLDLHCDTVLSMIMERNGVKSDLRKNNGHIDLERGKSLAGYAQCFACFTHPVENHPLGWTPEDIFEREYHSLIEHIQKNSDIIAFARNRKQIEENREKGLISAILTLEGTAGIGYDASLLEGLRKDGFCIVSLTWNEKNPLAGSHITGGRLTEQGREFVAEAQRVGMVVDVSHISDEAFWDIMDITNGPIIATHSNSRSVCSVSRNLTDDMFRAICGTGGVAGLNLYTDFVGENGDIDTACDHIFHFLSLDPHGDHVALGGDLDGCDSLPYGFEGVQDYPKLAQRLLARGISEEILTKIFWNNALGVIGKCSM